MKEKITEQHINTINKLFNDSLSTKLSKEQVENLLKEIIKNIDYDEIIEVNNNFLPKTIFYFFSLVNNYYTAYKLSENDQVKNRSNTLELLGKGNKKRIKRYEQNQQIINDENSYKDEKLVAYFENCILKFIIDGKYKTAYLILYMGFIHKDSILSSLKYNKQLKYIAEKMNKSLEFFSFTYLKPSKIVNSLTILMYLYLVEIKRYDKKQSLKLIRYIINTYFKDDAPSYIRDDFLNKEFYCAGIYNNLPIFHWHTSTKNKEYYTDENIKELYALINTVLFNSKFYKQIFLKTTTNNLTTEQKEQFKEFDESLLKKLIPYLPRSYIKLDEYKLISKFTKSKLNRFKFLILFLIMFIKTIFPALYTKFTTK